MNYIYFQTDEGNSNINNIIFHRHLFTITDVGLVLGIAVDPDAGKLYFSRYDDSKVEVASLNGSGRQTFISYDAPSKAVGLALDLKDG